MLFDVRLFAAEVLISMEMVEENREKRDRDSGQKDRGGASGTFGCGDVRQSQYGLCPDRKSVV